MFFTRYTFSFDRVAAPPTRVAMQLVYMEDLRRVLALSYRSRQSVAGVDRFALMSPTLFIDIVRTILREVIPHRTIPWCRSPALLRVEAEAHLRRRDVLYPIYIFV